MVCTAASRPPKQAKRSYPGQRCTAKKAPVARLAQIAQKTAESGLPAGRLGLQLLFHQPAFAVEVFAFAAEAFGGIFALVDEVFQTIPAADGGLAANPAAALGHLAQLPLALPGNRQVAEFINDFRPAATDRGLFIGLG